MKTYSITEVEEITGVKSHILRYWEEVVPTLAPQKSEYSGKRLYTARDIDTIRRLKYLIYEKKFTIEGARNQLIEDAGTLSKNFDLISQIRAVKSELTDLYFYAKKLNV